MTKTQLMVLAGVLVLLVWRLIRRRRSSRLRIRSKREQAAFQPVGTTYNPRPFRRERKPKR